MDNPKKLTFILPKKSLLKKKQEGKGINNNNDTGLYDFEINKICESMGQNNFNYCGCIPFDKLNMMMDIIKAKDKKTFSFIINTSNNVNDKKNLKHWIAVYCDGISVEYYDPQAYNIRYLEFKKTIEPYIKEMFKEYTLKIKYNMIRNQ